MAEAYIYDAVRTPRGKGKPDGALHEVTALQLATHVLKAVRDRNELDTSLVDDVVLGVVSPVKEQGADIARVAVINADYAETVAGVQINRFCASGLEATNMAAAQVMAGQSDFAIGGGVESMSRVAMGSDGGAWATDPDHRLQELLRAAGHRRRPDRHQVGLLARRCRRVRGREPEARRGRLEGWPLQEVGGAGEGPDRPHPARSRRAHAPRHHHAVAGQPEAVVRAARRGLRLRCGRQPALPGGRAHRARAPRRQLVGHRRRRGRHPDRQQGGGRRRPASSRAPASAPSPRSARSRRSC